MSENILNHFISFLTSGNILALADRYYNDNVKITLNEDFRSFEKVFGIGLLQRTLGYVEIIQFKVVDILLRGDIISYNIYIVAKTEDNKIDFSKHHIENKWKNNLIYQHNHIINHH